MRVYIVQEGLGEPRMVMNAQMLNDTCAALREDWASSDPICVDTVEMSAGEIAALPEY